MNDVLKTKLLASGILVQQALNNSKAQFASSPNLEEELTEAIIAALDAHMAMGQQALDFEQVRAGIKRVLLGPGQLWEMPRQRGEAVGAAEGASQSERLGESSTPEPELGLMPFGRRRSQWA